MLSDCYQFSDTLRFDNDDTFPAGIEAALQKFSDLKMLPKLDGVVLKVPFMMSGSNIKLPKGRRSRGIDFWKTYADRTGAIYDDGAPDAGG